MSCTGDDDCSVSRNADERTLCRFLDLRNQASMDAAKLAKINEYEHRIKTLTKTLAVWYGSVLLLVFFFKGLSDRADGD